MVDLLKTRFHDATISNIKNIDSDIELLVEDILLDNEKYNAFIVFHSVSVVLRNGKEAADFQMEDEDGEILEFDIYKNHAELTIQWNNFRNKTRFVSKYEFSFSAMEIREERSDPFS